MNGLSLSVLLCLTSVLLSGVLSAERLWDREPSLWNLAQQETTSQEIPPSDPQPVGTWGGGTAVGMSTLEMKISLWGPPQQLTLSLGKTDVWDRRQFQEKPLPLKEICEAVKDGRCPEPPERHYGSVNAYESPGPKPVGQVILGCGDFEGAGMPTAVTRLHNGIRQVELKKDGAKAVIRYLPMMTQNIIAADCEFESVRQPVWIRLYRHQDTIPYGKSYQRYGGPEPKPNDGYDYSKDKNNGPIDPPTSGTDGTFFWIRQKFPAEKTFPQGFEYVLMGRIVGCQAKFETVDGQKKLGTLPEQNAEQKRKRPNKDPDVPPFYELIREAAGSAATATLPRQNTLKFRLLTAVVTSGEAADPLAEAKKNLAEAEKRTFDDWIEENARWYEALYHRREKGRVFRGDSEYSRKQMPGIFISWLCPHSGDCLPNPCRYEADASYNWLEQDSSPWHGLPCYNELYYTAVHVQNQSDRLTMWTNLVNFWLPACRKNAQEVFGLPGALIQHGYLPPIKADSYFHTTSIWEFCMEIPAQVLKVLWEAFDYGGNEKFLAESVYPAMKELAIFYSHYATLGGDGYYHVFPTVEAEYWGWTKNFEKNRDTTSSLCMFLWLLNTASDASEILNCDADLRPRWREVAAKMAPYPTWQSPEGPIFTDVWGVNPIIIKGYNFFAGVAPALLADEINLDSPKDQQDMMLRTARLVKGWMNGSVPIVLAAEKGFGLEQLINSRSGRIHLFPAVPDDAAVAFRDLQARGGFEVSAESIKGQITYVRLHARRNVECRLMNPWPGRAVSIFEAENQPVTYKMDSSNGECICFAARGGADYNIEVKK
jgi:hypothetical protein